MPETILLADYDRKWPEMFQEAKKALVAAVGSHVEQIEHIGGTEQPGCRRVASAAYPGANGERVVRVGNQQQQKNEQQEVRVIPVVQLVREEDEPL